MTQNMGHIPWVDFLNLDILERPNSKLRKMDGFFDIREREYIDRLDHILLVRENVDGL